MAFYHRKANLGPLHPAVGFAITFDDDRTHVRRAAGDVAELAAGLPLWDRIGAVRTACDPQRRPKNSTPKSIASIASFRLPKPFAKIPAPTGFTGSPRRTTGVMGVTTSEADAATASVSVTSQTYATTPYLFYTTDSDPIGISVGFPSSCGTMADRAFASHRQEDQCR